MREDFNKVVIARARWGSRMRNLKTGWSTSRYDPDENYALPKRWNSPTKAFSDHLSPLKRYLAKQVGRPWRKVEGEFRKALDTRTIIGKHLWDHARREVELECRMGADGRPRTLRGHPVRNLYVHPRSGLLLRPKPERVDEHRARQERIAGAQKVVLDAATWAEKEGDLWYLFIDTGRTEEVVEIRKDRAGKEIRVIETRDVIRKKQANTGEIRLIRTALEKNIL